MKITSYTDYALRVLVYLAVNEGRLATIQEVADSYRISKNHLMKVVHDLGLRGYIDSVRGKHGGIRLRQAPERISLGALVRDTEQDFMLSECFGTGNACVITPACRIKHALREALAAFLKVLDGYSLADMITPETRPQLLQLLHCPASPGPP